MDLKEYIQASGQRRRMVVTLVCDFPEQPSEQTQDECAVELQKLVGGEGPLSGFSWSYRTEPPPISADVIRPLMVNLSSRAYNNLSDVLWGTIGEHAKYVLDEEGPACAVACLVNEHESDLQELLEFLGVMPQEEE